MTAFEDAPTPAPDAPIGEGDAPRFDLRRQGQVARIRRAPPVYYVVCDPGDRPLTTAERDLLREVGTMMLRLRIRISSCGCNGGTWLATHRGRMLDRFALVDSAPTDPRLAYVKVERPK